MSKFPFRVEGFMKKLISSIVMSFLLTYPLGSSASYLIQLRNGGELITYHYWEDGGEIKLYIYGGIVGIQKDVIKDIKKTDLVPRETSIEPKPPTEEPETASTQTEAKTQVESSTAESNSNDQLMKIFKLLKERFKDIQMMTGAELTEFSDDVMDFKKKVLATHSAHLYTDELAKVYAMGDTAEDLLKARGQ